MWSIANFGLSLLFIRLCTPVEYGTFAFWVNTGYVLVSLMNAVSVSHLFVLAPSDVLSPPRLPVERLMHVITGAFLLVAAMASIVLKAIFDPHATLIELIAPALYLLAFLLQNYVRSLAFSRGRIKTAMLQTGLSLVVALAGVLVFGKMHNLSAAEILYILGICYGVTGSVAMIIAAWGQFKGWTGIRWTDFWPFVRDSGWILIGVTSTEILARFYAFATTAKIGPSALASLTATQQLLRPLPLLASSLVAAERPQLAKRRDAGDISGLTRITINLCAVGIVVSVAWTAIIALSWSFLTRSLFAGKYTDDGWMIVLWGAACASSFCQFVVSASIQSLKAFKPLAIANLTAAVFAAIAIVILMQFFGILGAIVGTLLGQLLELVAMIWLFIRCISRSSIDTPVKRIMKP